MLRLFERSPEFFNHGIALGYSQSDVKVGRDYLGLILDRAVVYNSYGRSAADKEKVISLNDPSFALGALVGITKNLGAGRFSGITNG